MEAALEFLYECIHLLSLTPEISTQSLTKRLNKIAPNVPDIDFQRILP